MPNIDNYGWLFFAALSAVFASLTAIFGKIGIEGVPSNYGVLVRILVILPFIGGLVLAAGDWRNPASLSQRTLLFLVLSGLATGLSWLCYYKALQVGQASQVAPVDKLSVILTMLFGVLVLREELGWKQWLGGALILAGVLLVAMPRK